MHPKTRSPHIVACIGLLFLIPFVILNVIVVFRIEPFFSLIRPDVTTSTLEYVLLIGTLLLFPVAFFITVRPMLQNRSFYLFNTIIAVLILMATVLLWGGFSNDIIACDIFKISNCD